MIRPRIGSILAAATLLVACDWLPGAGEPDIEGEWRLEQGTYDGQPIAVVADHPITLRIEGGQAGGTSGCNQYGGEVGLDGWSIRIGPVSMTEMACDEPVMAAEGMYVAALTDVTTVEHSRSLVLTGPNSELRYSIVVPEPDAALVGTTWVLDTLISGDAASSIGGERATLTLDDQGGLEGTTGCRAFRAAYQADGASVRVTDLDVDDVICTEAISRQDRSVLAVIESGFQVAIEGRRLTLTAGDQGLGYTAESD
jgi:heat shock protein HslJ